MTQRHNQEDLDLKIFPVLNQAGICDLGTGWIQAFSFMPLPLYPSEESPGIHFIGGCVGPRVGIDAAKKKKSCPCRESNPGRPAFRLITILTGISRLIEVKRIKRILNLGNVCYC